MPAEAKRLASSMEMEVEKTVESEQLLHASQRLVRDKTWVFWDFECGPGHRRLFVSKYAGGSTFHDCVCFEDVCHLVEHAA